jgi:zinc resistance-associated protein
MGKAQKISRRQKMKKTLAVAGIMLLVAAIAVPVLAYGPNWGRGRHMQGYWQGGPGACPQYGPGYTNLTEEQRAELGALRQKFYEDMAPLRDEVRTKRAELNTLLSTPDPDVEKAKALQQEISALKAKIAEARLDFALEVRKVDPNARFGMGPGRGWGSGKWERPHTQGYGPGYGQHGPGYYGRHMRGYGPGMGYGPGYCWQ